MFRDWTLRETLFVRDYAGTVTLARLAAMLGRDVRDVASEAARLGVPFVYVGTPLEWCNECAGWTRKLAPSGLCPRCQARRYRRRVEGRVAALLRRLPRERREVYAVTEAERGARAHERPPAAPDVSGMPPREAVAALSRFWAERSDWEAREEQRARKSAQKRKERIAHKVAALEASTVPSHKKAS